MEAFNLYSFISPIVILLEIYIISYIFSLGVEKRDCFWFRFIGYGIFSVLFIIWMIVMYCIITGDAYGYGEATNSVVATLFNFVLYLLVFFVVNIVYYFSYKQTLTQVLSCCSAAYAAQHIVKNATDLFSLIPGCNNIFSAIFHAVFFISICFFFYFIFIRKKENVFEFNRNNKIKVLVSVFIIFICIGMSRLTSDNEGRNLISSLAESIYAIACSFLVLYVQFGIFEKDSMQYEIDNMQELLHQEKKQYELSKETIDLINMKCHDLKYQINDLRENYSEKNISSIENAVMIYDCSVKTGNDVLDVILTEKKLQCESKNIHMTCAVKGEQISFLSNMDIYSLFGNLLTNAIEAVSLLKEEERCISINIRSVEKMIFIHIENCYDGEIKFEQGLPITKNDKNFHGFGMKSIQRIVKKYNGELSITTNEGQFMVDIFMPIPTK